jgi:glycosyltransferase involved in cell wall biosynthesis
VLSEGGRLASAIEEAGGENVLFRAATKNPARILWNAHLIARIIASEGVSLVHARSRAPAWSALIAARRMGKPFVTTYHGAYGERGRLKSLYNSVMARGDVVIANSRYTSRLISARYGTPEARMRVIYRGVDEQQFDAAAVAPERVAALRDRWGIAPDARVILQAARLTGWKGQSVVVEAARLLKDASHLEDAVIVMAGDAQGRDNYRGRLEHMVADAGLARRIRLVGHVDDMPAAFCAAHLAVVASTEPEAFGRAAAEAQAMGCPVIATDIGAPPETVLAPPRVEAAERTGWLVPPGDARRLADAMTEALAFNPEARAAIGSRARSHVLQAFSLNTMRLQTLGVYDELLGTGLAAEYSEASRLSQPELRGAGKN